jgi:hypothetical protein
MFNLQGFLGEVAMKRPWMLFGLVALAATPAQAADVDKLLPNDCECIVTVNVRQVLDSELNKKFGLVKMQELLSSSEDVQDTLKSLGLDPLKDIQTVTWASSNTGDSSKALIIIHGKFDPARFHTKADETIRAYPDVLKIHKAGATRLYEVGFSGQTSFFVAVIDSRTIAASTGRECIQEALDKGAGTKKAGVSKELSSLVAQMEGERALWMVALKSALEHSPLSADDEARPVLAKVETVSIGVTVAEELQADFRMTAKNAEAAKELSKNIAEKLDKAKGIVSILIGNVKELQILLELAGAMKVSTQENLVSLHGQVGSDAIEKSLKK